MNIVGFWNCGIVGMNIMKTAVSLPFSQFHNFIILQSHIPIIP